jgi:hypothetical protein
MFTIANLVSDSRNRSFVLDSRASTSVGMHKSARTLHPPEKMISIKAGSATLPSPSTRPKSMSL